MAVTGQISAKTGMVGFASLPIFLPTRSHLKIIWKTIFALLCFDFDGRGHAQSFFYLLLHFSGSFAFMVNNLSQERDNPRKI